jgi:hypothetical protein
MTIFRHLFLFALAASLIISCGDDDDDPVRPSDGNRLLSISGDFMKINPNAALAGHEVAFAVTNDEDKPQPNVWVRFGLLGGSGLLSPDSALSDSEGVAKVIFDFADSTSGHAVIQATAAGKSEAQVALRRSVLIPQVQGQYVLLNETYDDIIAINGPPERIDTINPPGIFAVVYEDSLGVVFIINDEGEDGVITGDEAIFEIIVNDNEDSDPSNNYMGKTPGGHGIGATVGEFKEEFGPNPWRTPANDQQPEYMRYEWDSLGLVVYSTYTTDGAQWDNMDAREIHIQSF